MAIAASVQSSRCFESSPGLPRIFPYASTTTNGSTAGCSARRFSISLWNVRPYTSAHASTPRWVQRSHSGCAIDSPLSLSSTGPATLRHTPNATSASGYPTFRKLCSKSSSTHCGGTCTARAATMRSCSLVSSPVAVAAAFRTRARVWGSRLIVPLPTPHSPILSPLQPPIHTHLPHRLPARVRDRLREQRRRLRLEAQLGQHRRDRQRRRQAVAVFDLEGDAKAFANEGCAIDTFSTDLRDHASRMRTHQLGTGSALTCYQLRMVQHGLTNCGLWIADCGFDFSLCNPRSEIRNPESGVGQGHISQRQREARHTAPVHRDADVLDRHVRELADRFQTPLLHRVLDARVELRRPTVVLRQRQHARVLPRAIRVHRREPHAARLVIPGDRVRQRPVRAAHEVALRALGALQELAHQRHLRRLARMRGARQREVLAREPETLDDTVLHEWLRLKRLRGGAPEGDEIRIAGAGNDPPVAVYNRNVDDMARLHDRAAAVFD